MHHHTAKLSSQILAAPYFFLDTNSVLFFSAIPIFIFNSIFEIWQQGNKDKKVVLHILDRCFLLKSSYYVFFENKKQKNWVWAKILILVVLY